MASTIINILLSLFICSSITFYFGYLFGRSRAPLRGSRLNPIFKQEGNIYNKPQILGVPRPKGKDDLKEIKGIDSDLESELNDLGIFHFDQISKWSSRNQEWVEVYLNISGQIESDKWLSQSVRLVDNKRK